MNYRNLRCPYVFALCALASISVHAGTVSTNSELTGDQVAKVRSIIAADQLLSGLVKAQEGLSALNALLKSVAPGPAKLALQWDQANIDAWKKINNKLVQIHKQASCDAIALELIESTDPGYTFFEQLSKARGCDQ